MYLATMYLAINIASRQLGKFDHHHMISCRAQIIIPGSNITPKSPLQICNRYNTGHQYELYLARRSCEYNQPEQQILGNCTWRIHHKNMYLTSVDLSGKSLEQLEIVDMLISAQASLHVIQKQCPDAGFKQSYRRWTDVTHAHKSIRV
jgi:hypothetical protein